VCLVCRVVCARRVVAVGLGPGVAFPKSRCSGCDAGHAGLGRPRLPSRARLGGVGLETLVERVADAAFQCADRFFGCLSFGEFAVVVAAAG